MSNAQLFEWLNAAPGLPRWQLGAATAVALWMIYAIPLAMAAAWLRGDATARRELLEMLLAVLVALGVAQIVTLVWPQPRPFVLHLGTQLLAHTADPGLPSDHVTVFWSLALAALATRRFRAWGLPLLAGGLVVGWSRVFLGVHFPYDVLAALPVAAFGAIFARTLRSAMQPAYGWILGLWDRLTRPIFRR